MITIVCPACAKAYDVEHSAAGRKATCKCGHSFLVESPAPRELPVALPVVTRESAPLSPQPPANPLAGQSILAAASIGDNAVLGVFAIGGVCAAAVGLLGVIRLSSVGDVSLDSIVATPSWITFGVGLSVIILAQIGSTLNAIRRELRERR